MANPFDQFDSAGPVMGPPPIPEKPPTALQIRAAERADTAAQRADDAAELAREKFEYQKQQDKDKPGGGADPKVQAKLANLEALTGQINRVQDLYNRNLRDEAIPLLSSLWEYLPTPANRQFDSAAAGMAEQGLAAFRVPGVGAQSDTELRQFVDANKPSAADADLSIEEKLRQLRARVQATREQMGLPAPQWTGLPDGQDEAPPVAAGAAPPVDGGGNPPSPPPFSPGDPQYQAATGDMRTVADTDLNKRLESLLRSGASYSEMSAAAREAGGSIDPRQYAAARKALRDNPDYPHPIINATKQVPVSNYDQAVTAVGDNPAGAFIMGAGQFLSGNTLDNIGGEDAALALEMGRAQSPTATTLGEITGGVLGAVGAEAGLLRAGVQGALKRGTLADMAMGSANAAGAADDGNRLAAGATGALAGGAGSLGGYGLSRIAGSALSTVGGVTNRAAGRDQNVAVQQVGKALQDDRVAPREAGNMIQDAQSRGSPMTLADVGENTRELLASVSRPRGDARNTAKTFVKDRQAAQMERIASSVRQELGATTNVREMGEAFIDAAKTNSRPIYDEAFKRSGAGAVYPVIQTLLSRPSMTRAMVRARRIAAEEGRDPTALGFDLDDAGEVTLTRVPSWETLHYLKTGIDDVIEDYRDKTTGRLVLDAEGRAINNTLRSFLKVVDKYNPSYAEARQAYAGPVRLRSALEKGVGAIRRAPDDISANIRDLTPGELEMYRMGARKGIVDALEGRGDFADKVNFLIGTEKKRKALTEVFGTEEGFSNLQKVLSDEAAMGQTYKSVATGSQTADRMAFDSSEAEGRIADVVDLATAAKTGGLTGMGFAVAKRIAEVAQLGAGKAGDLARAQIADILTSSSYDELRAIISQTKRLAAMQRAKQIKQKAISRGVADVTGIGAAYGAVQTSDGQ